MRNRLPARHVILSEALAKMTHVDPPIMTTLSSFTVENPEPPRVMTVPVPGGPPGPDEGDMEVS